MTDGLIALSLLLPLLLPLLYLQRSCRTVLLRTLPIAALPALLLALAGSEETLDWPWLMEGTVWGLDDVRRVFLAFTSLLWGTAGLFAVFYLAGQPRSPHFAMFWLFTLAGNLGLILAQDIASFYTFFALMTIAAYGLVAHNRDTQAQRAGRVYIIMALAGEMALLAGLIMAAAIEGLTLLSELPAGIAASDYRNWIIALLFGGFGVKAGALLLHVWLPLAHPAAPTPASAVLSGAMIKAGLFGWLFTLPLGQLALPVWSYLVMGFGLLAAFGAALVGVCQRVPKAVLAYSSISQMGLMTALLGVGLADPAHWEAVLAAIVLYAMHHGLAKGALFLSAGAAPHAGGWPRWLCQLLVWLPALSLTGLVLTSGAAAKSAVKEVLHEAGTGLWLDPWLEGLFTAGAVATTLLVARYLWCLRPVWGREENNNALLGSWALACLCSLLLFWLLPRPPGLLAPAYPSILVAQLADGLGSPLAFLWPPVLGLVLAAAALSLRFAAPAVPPGDLIVPLEQGVRRGRALLQQGANRLQGLQKGFFNLSVLGGIWLYHRSETVRRAGEALRARAMLTFAIVLCALLLVLLLPLML